MSVTGRLLAGVVMAITMATPSARASEAFVFTGASERIHADAVRIGHEWRVVYWFVPLAYGFSTTVMTGDIATGLVTNSDGLKSISGTGSAEPGAYTVSWNYHDQMSGHAERGAMTLTILA